MAKAKVGVQMIEMYCGMVKEKFNPILRALDIRKSNLKRVATVEAKKKLGIYELYVEKFKYEHRLREINEELKSYEDRSLIKGQWESKLESAIEQTLKDMESLEVKDIISVYDKIIWDLKMMGVDDTTKAVLSNLDKIITDLAEKVKQLPPVVIPNDAYLIEEE